VVALGVFARASGGGGERLCLKVAAIQRGRNVGAQGLARFLPEASLFPPQDTHSVIKTIARVSSLFSLPSSLAAQCRHFIHPVSSRPASGAVALY